MMKKVLYVNYMLQYGHVNFDLIHIRALMSQGYDVSVIAHAKVARKIPLPEDVFLLRLPDWLDRDTNNGLVNRIMYILTLLYIRLHVRVSDYDCVIVSNLEELSLWLVSLGSRMLICSHGPNDSIRSRMKAWLARRLSVRNRFLVFNDHMKIPFRSVGIDSIDVISHGCMPPYHYNESIPMPEWVREGQKLIFHPSNRPNSAFVDELMADDDLQKQLEKMDAVLILRDRSGRYRSKGRIRIVTEYLSTEVYQNLFLRADVILMAYPEDFLYKVSGVSYECFANRKKILILSNPSFFYCREFFNYDPLFESVAEMTDKIGQLITNPEYCCKADADQLAPDYSSII